MYVCLHRNVDLGRPNFAHWKALSMVGSGSSQLPLYYICILKGMSTDLSVDMSLIVSVSESFKRSRN